MTEKAGKLDRLPKSAPDLDSSDPSVTEFAGGEADEFERDKRAIELEGRRYELDARKIFGVRIYRLVVAWLAAVLVLTFLSGYPHIEIWGKFKGPVVSDGVLIALISGMSVNVIALLAVVIKYLFPKKSN